MTDLLSLVVSVRPAEQMLLPNHLGRAVYAVLMRWLHDQDAALAERWHDSEGHKPYTCSTLIGGKHIGKEKRLIVPDETYWFRITALDPEVVSALRKIIANPPETVELDGHQLTVTAMTTDCGIHEWAGETTYEALAVPYLMARETPPRKLRLRFVSPTFFRQNEIHTPVPLPELVFGSLCNRWNTFSPIAVSDQVRAYAAQGIAMSAYRLSSQVMIGKNEIPHMGAVGHCRYVAVRYDKYWMSVAALLADFAFYSGVGRTTAAGAGQARRGND